MASLPDNVIRVEGLSKRYRIGARQAGYRTFRETLMHGLKASWSSAQRIFHRPKADCRCKSENNSIWALKNISLEIRRGDILGIIGRNGAGKTTLLKILSRITEPTAGRAVIRGRVGSLLEVGTGFHPELSGRENIFLNGAILNMSSREIQRKFGEIVEFAEIGKFIDTPLKHYSTGMATRLAFAIAAHLDTEILLVDEVLAVGDMGFRKRCLGKMKDVTQEGRTVIFVSHEMNAIRRLCKSALWLEEGEVRGLGEVSDMVARYEESFVGQESNLACQIDRGYKPDSPKYFSWVSLAPPQGEAKTIFNFGDTMRLTLGMGGRTPDQTHYVEWFLNERSQGTPVSWGATHALLEGDVAGEAKQVSFIIGPLPLAEGQYFFSFALGVPGVTNHDIWRDAITFEVMGSDPNGTGFHYTTRYAPTVIPYKIEIS
jgi:lipopolysaccharide transport system ATP-binding protein